MPYSVLILTRNEAHNLPRSLRSLTACDDIAVVDSFSTDDTVEIAKAGGAEVWQRNFDSFAAQRNWGVETISFKHDWILHLDADEEMTPALHREIEAVVGRDEKSAYLIANKLMFMGRWIRHASMYPHYQARLLKRGESRFTQTGHGQILGEATRGVGTLREAYVHHNFSRGVADWVTRHNRYSTDEARRIVAEHSGGGPGEAGIAAQSRQQRWKRLADRIPCKPAVRFLYLYFYRGGILDGRAGFDYCVLMAFYDYLTRLKVRESMKILSTTVRCSPETD
jgi:glycosyltransferase involved in cell wall biosynthesis